jgi:membrane protease YdiL (CAAX protease family)
MMRQLMLKTSGWGAILISSGFFAIWHLGWPLRHLLDGTATIGEAAFEAFSLMLATFIAGITYGYLYFKTNNLWGPFLGHTINNTLLNVLFFKTISGIQAATSLMVFMPLVLLGYLILLPCFKLISDRWRIKEVTAWES